MRLVHAAATAFIAIVLVGCKEPNAVPPVEDASLSIQVSITGTTIAALALEVTGPGIAVPLMKNLTVSGTTATTTIEVPAGADRRFVIRGYDAAGILVYQGEKTASLQSGQSLTLDVTLAALTSTPTVTVTIGAVTVTLTPGAATLPVGSTTTYSATASDNGVPVANPAITWASSVPTIASVSATGVVTGHAPGTARIVASFRGVAASAEITVQE